MVVDNTMTTISCRMIPMKLLIYKYIQIVEKIGIVSINGIAIVFRSDVANLLHTMHQLYDKGYLMKIATTTKLFFIVL